MLKGGICPSGHFGVTHGGEPLYLSAVNLLIHLPSGCSETESRDSCSCVYGELWRMVITKEVNRGNLSGEALTLEGSAGMCCPQDTPFQAIF